MNDEVKEITGEELLEIVENFESLEAEKKVLSESQKEILKEAKNSGYDTKIIRQMIRARRKTKEQREEEETIFELYMKAVEESSSN